MNPYILTFASRGLGRLRYQTIFARDENQANMLGESIASRGKRESYIGIAESRKKNYA